MTSLAKNSGEGAKNRTGSSRKLSFTPETVGLRGSHALRPGRLPENGPASVSHELRNLLTALNLYSDLLAEPGVLTLPYSHMADEIKLIAQAGKRVLGTLNRLPGLAGQLDSEIGRYQTPASLASGEGGTERASGMVTEHQLAPVLDSCLPLLAHMAGPQVHVHLKCAKNHGSLPLSSEDLTMILVNLVRNAAEAMPGGGGVWIAIQPAVRRCNRAARCARIVVEDDGPGIPVKARTHLFESGFTTKTSLIPSGRAVELEHHGLGLAIVRQQVESAGGVIQARLASTRGGARFEIRIPFPSDKVQRKLQMSGTTNCKEQITGAKEPE